MKEILKTFPPRNADTDVYVQKTYNGWEDARVALNGLLHQLDKLPPVPEGKL
jgi:hypothetical protein